VKLGMNLPVMAPGLDRATFMTWCREIDQGPWSSIATGDRVNFHNPDATVSLAAAAVLTERVRIVANVLVLPMHNIVSVAKQYATIDVLSGGRLTLGVGVGGREEDYLAMGADWSAPKLGRLQDGVERIRALWSGTQKAHPAALRPLEPEPIQQGGIEVLAGALGPRSIARAAQWADGTIGFSFGMVASELQHAFDTARRAWRDAGRSTPPRLVTGCWFALGPDADAQMDRYLAEYLNFLGPIATAAIPLATIRGEAALREAAARARDLGADELLLTPTSADPAQLAAAADVLS